MPAFVVIRRGTEYYSLRRTEPGATRYQQKDLIGLLEVMKILSRLC
jgi:hypothetical protein